MKIKEKWPHLLLAALILGFCIYEVFWGGQGADWWVGADYGQDPEQTEEMTGLETVREAALTAETFYGQWLGAADSDNAQDETKSDTEKEVGENPPAERNGEEKKSVDGAEAETAGTDQSPGDGPAAGNPAGPNGPAGAGAAGNDAGTKGDSKQSEPLTCTLSVSCATVLNNMDSLDADKVELVPENGTIYPATTVEFKAGETVYDVLKREMKNNKIHMEYVNTPGYNTSYIEGIGNLYEFDCGPLSGWMYQVNGEFINYGCSLYELKDGDKINWVYTCDLGKDVGNTSFGG